MNPVGSDLAVDIPLSLRSSAYIDGENEYIADVVFPVIGVEKKTGTYYTFDRDSWYRTEADERAPSTESKGTGFTVSQAPLYNCRVYAVHSDIDDQTRAEQNSNGVFNLEQKKTIFVTKQLLLKRELLWADAYFKAGVWTRNYTGVASGPTTNQFLRFDDDASEPLDFIGDVMDDIEEQTGLVPNTMVVTPRVLRKLRRNVQILDAVRGQNGPRTLGRQSNAIAILQDLFEIERIVVARTIVNSAVEGAAASYGPLYGKHMLLVHAASTPDLEQPSGGYTFAWNGYPGAQFNGNAIYNFRMPAIKSERIEGEMAFDMRLIAPDLGAFLSGVVA